MEKIFLNLAGEFLVAAELNRRRILCAVTYGAAKSADVFAFGDIGGRVVRIEVKTTDKERWPVGNRGMSAAGSTHVWVLVHLPPPLDSKIHDDSTRGQHAPRFFVLTGVEVTKAARENYDAYSERYRKKHSVLYPEGSGVPIITLTQAVEHESAWRKIAMALADSEGGHGAC